MRSFIKIQRSTLHRGFVHVLYQCQNKSPLLQGRSQQYWGSVALTWKTDKDPNLILGVPHQTLSEEWNHWTFNILHRIIQNQVLMSHISMKEFLGILVYNMRHIEWEDTNVTSYELFGSTCAELYCKDIPFFIAPVKESQNFIRLHHQKHLHNDNSTEFGC